jgi:hypothetical protein
MIVLQNINVGYFPLINDKITASLDVHPTRVPVRQSHKETYYYAFGHNAAQH